MRMIIKEIVQLAPNNIAIIDPPIWSDILFVILLCGFVILIPLASLLLIFLLKKIKILKEDKLLRLSFSFIVYSASYLIFIMLDMSISGAIDHLSKISTNIPGIIFSVSNVAYPILIIVGLSITASLLVGNFFWFLIRRKKLIGNMNPEWKSVESE